MNEISCDICGATFTADMIKIQERVIRKDDDGSDITEKYFACPECGKNYTITVMDRQQRLAVQRRKQLQEAIRRSERRGNYKLAAFYKEKERLLAQEINRRKGLI